MAKSRHSSDSLDQWRRRLDRCWDDDCDIDPLILRTRLPPAPRTAPQAGSP